MTGAHAQQRSCALNVSDQPSRKAAPSMLTQNDMRGTACALPFRSAPARTPQQPCTTGRCPAPCPADAVRYSGAPACPEPSCTSATMHRRGLEPSRSSIASGWLPAPRRSSCSRRNRPPRARPQPSTPGRRSPNDSVSWPSTEASNCSRADPRRHRRCSVSRPQENATPPLGKKLSACCSCQQHFGGCNSGTPQSHAHSTRPSRQQGGEAIEIDPPPGLAAQRAKLSRRSSTFQCMLPAK